MKLVFICGPYRGESAWEVEQNVRKAEELSLEVWRLGAACICPHTNTRFFQGALRDVAFLEGYLAILDRCDAVLTVPGWGKSYGSKAEVTYAKEHGIPVLHTMKEFIEWVSE